MDNLLSAALNEQQSLRKQKEDIDARLAELDVFVRIHASLSKKIGNVLVAAAPSPVTVASVAVATPNAVPTVSRTVIATADDVVTIAKSLLSGGRWATSEEITEAIKARGYTITAARHVARVSQILSGSQQFLTQRGKGWSLKIDEVNRQQSLPGQDGATTLSTH